MNRLIPRAGAWMVTVTVFLFALCLITDWSFGAYFVCMLLPIGYIMMVAGFHHESGDEQRVAANIGLIFAAIYAALVFVVYFAQLTSVRLDGLNAQAMSILDFKRGGLLFHYDLLGYGMMALSTCFTGLSMKADCRADKWLKSLMMIHGVFFVGCFVMPMTGVFSGMSSGETSVGGVAALVVWCAYFLPIGVLAYRHFGRQPD